MEKEMKKISKIFILVIVLIGMNGVKAQEIDFEYTVLGKSISKEIEEYKTLRWSFIGGGGGVILVLGGIGVNPGIAVIGGAGVVVGSYVGFSLKIKNLKKKYKKEEIFYKKNREKREEKRVEERRLRERQRILLVEQRQDRIIKKYGKSNGNLILAGKIKIGMTREMCIESWGSPTDINRTIDTYGTHEQWVYDQYNAYLYFDDGILTTIQN